MYVKAVDISPEAAYTRLLMGHTKLSQWEKIKYVLKKGNPSYCFKRITQHRMFHYLLKQTIIAEQPSDQIFNTFANFVFHFIVPIVLCYG